MKYVVWTGKAIFTLIWLALFITLFAMQSGQLPASPQAQGLLWLLLAVIVVMHLLLLMVFLGVLKSQVHWRSQDIWHIMAFGVFAWLAILQRPAQAPRSTPPRQ
ncbi:DUF1145 domain-containing protein [Idiomarina tyrosinivorans]|uniref:DUF1145 domain-containing protein n=1 Tax=Idiomarina tyrosinivorans TaxID=1445662 RepID=A0A432ZTF8_9GAMM|nr:DUF1145 domain-containing protein [Idiomarina tyrosinivorans]RUO81121.1 DUF1145 domain-containing protein [Idiomarina tyrosinivorans]